MALITLVKSREEQLAAVDLSTRALKERRSVPPMSEDTWIRVSSIGGMCAREEVLCSKHNIIREDIVDGYAGINFQMGNAIHWMMQNKVLAPTGKIIGSWRCTYCGEVYGSRSNKMVPRPETCLRCGAVAGDVPRVDNKPVAGVQGNAFLYVEEWLGDSELKIGGSPDGQMVYGDPNSYSADDVVMLEFKSANERNFFKYKNAPDFMHAIQTQVYLWLTGFKKAKIIYFNKNFSPSDQAPFNEHDFDYDPDVIERVRAMVIQIREGVAGGRIPARTVCAARSCFRAGKCQVADICFRD